MPDVLVFTRRGSTDTSGRATAAPAHFGESDEHDDEHDDERGDRAGESGGTTTVGEILPDDLGSQRRR